MKAFLLAAGLGKRLRPITLHTPKCLVPIHNIPLMDYWLKIFEQANIDNILINLHHLTEKVEEHVKAYQGPVQVEIVFEEVLLGSLGTILANKQFFENDQSIVICYADNFTNLNLQAMLDFHDSHSFPFTMGLFETDQPTQCGIVEMDNNSLITYMEEKPKHPRSNLANAGVYVADTTVFHNMEYDGKTLLDIGYDLLPRLVNNMAGYRIPEFLIDIGTPEKLEFTNEYVKQHIDEFTPYFTN